MRKILILFQFFGSTLADGNTETIEILPGNGNLRTMGGRTIPKIRTGTDFGTWYRFLVRDLMVRYVVRIFGTDFFQYGTWYGFRSGIFMGTVRYVFRTKIRTGTDFRTEFRTTYRTEKSVPKIPYQIKFRTKNSYHGTVRPYMLRTLSGQF